MAALSVSRVMRPCSLATASPGLTITSMTSTSLKLPMSGTLTSFSATAFSLNRDRIGFVGTDPVFLHGLGDLLGVQLAFVRQGLERGQRHVTAVHLEEVAQASARIAAAETVGAEHRVAARHELADLVGEQLHVVGGGDDGTRALGERLGDVRHPRLLVRMEQVPAGAIQAFAAQLREA